MALFIYLRVIPTAQAILMSFFDWELVAPAKDFVGLDNYVNLLSDENFRLALTNTTVFAVVTTIISVVAALGLASIGVTECVFRVPSAGADEVLPVLDRWMALIG